MWILDLQRDVRSIDSTAPYSFCRSSWPARKKCIYSSRVQKYCELSSKTSFMYLLVQLSNQINYSSPHGSEWKTSLDRAWHEQSLENHRLDQSLSIKSDCLRRAHWKWGHIYTWDASWSKQGTKESTCQNVLATSVIKWRSQIWGFEYTFK